MALQKIERKISWNLYITAFVISLIIFGIGIWFGLQIERSVTEQIDYKINSLDNRLIAVANIMLMENETGYCDYLKSEMNKFDEETYELGMQIEFMEEKRGVDPNLKINYMELEFRDYLLSKKLNEMCGKNETLVLYFVSSEECNNCKLQGENITSARKKIGMRVYTFDVSINSSVTRALIERFNISNVPIIVINDKIYNKFMSEEEIISASQ